jgi:thymidylate synthase
MAADELELPVGTVTLYVKSAHVYEPEWELMGRLAASAAPR